MIHIAIAISFNQSSAFIILDYGTTNLPWLMNRVDDASSGEESSRAWNTKWRSTGDIFLVLPQDLQRFFLDVLVFLTPMLRIPPHLQ